jgi:hypothetical protein
METLAEVTPEVGEGGLLPAASRASLQGGLSHVGSCKREGGDADWLDLEGHVETTEGRVAVTHTVTRGSGFLPYVTKDRTLGQLLSSLANILSHISQCSQASNCPCL